MSQIAQRVAEARASLRRLAPAGLAVTNLHLTRGLERYEAADRAPDQLPEHAPWREAVVEFRSALEQVLLDAAREAAAALGASLPGEEPGKVRVWLLDVGFFPGKTDKELVDRIYGASSEQTAHPGFPSRARARMQVGVVLDALAYAAELYEAARARAFRRVAAAVGPAEVAHAYAQALHGAVTGAAGKAAGKSPDRGAAGDALDVELTVGEHGVSEARVRARSGEAPLEHGLAPLTPEAADRLRRAFYLGEAVSLANADDRREFALSRDPRAAPVLEAVGFGESDVAAGAELLIAPSMVRAVRLTAGAGSAADVPHAELVWVGPTPPADLDPLPRSPAAPARPANGAEGAGGGTASDVEDGGAGGTDDGRAGHDPPRIRVALRSRHLSYDLFFDVPCDPDAGAATRLALAPKSDLTARRHAATLRFLRAATDAGAPVVVRSLPEDDRLCQFPASAVVDLIAGDGPGALQDHAVEAWSALGRVEAALEAAGAPAPVRLVLDDTWSPADLEAVLVADRLVCDGHVRLDASWRFRLPRVQARRLADPSDPPGTTALRRIGPAGEWLRCRGAPLELGLVEVVAFDYTVQVGGGDGPVSHAPEEAGETHASVEVTVTPAHGFVLRLLGPDDVARLLGPTEPATGSAGESPEAGPARQ